jgi:tetratricopeptide (TPR) repeat protein
VYAFRSELDAWSRGRGIGVAQQEGASLISTAPQAPTGGERHPAMPRGLVIAAGILVLVVCAVLVIAFTRKSSSPSGAPAITTGTPEAQELVRRAQYLSDRTTDADNQTAIKLLERAREVDPLFALAHAELASAYVTRLAYVTPEETDELEQRSSAAAQTALSLDPNLPEVYLARGDLLWTHAYRFAHERAIQEFRRALGLNPKSNQAHRRLARVLVHVGFFDEARQHADSALTLNPGNSQALNTRAQSLLWSGRVDEALKILVGMPGPVLPELVEANTVFALHALGRTAEASSYLDKALQKYPTDPTGNVRGIQALLLSESDPPRAQALIASVRERKAANPSHHAAYFAACASARLRKPTEAVEWLKEAAATGFPCYSLFARDPNLDPIRKDPQFQAFIGEMREQSASLRKALFPRSRTGALSGANLARRPDQQ